MSQPTLMNLKLITAPTVEPLTLQETKLHANIYSDDTDSLVGLYIQAAREKWEKETRYHVSKAGYELTSSSLVSEFTLPLRPVLVNDDVELTVNDLTEDTDYTLEIDSRTGVATIKFLTGVPSDVTINFFVGYEDPAEPEGDEDPLPHPAPAQIKLVLLQLVTHWFEQRAAYTDGGEMKSLPAGYFSAVQSYR